MKSVAGKSLTYTAVDLIKPAAFKNLQLIPFLKYMTPVMLCTGRKKHQKNASDKGLQ